MLRDTLLVSAMHEQCSCIGELVSSMLQQCRYIQNYTCLYIYDILYRHIWVVCGMDLHTGGQAPSRRFPPEVIFGSYNTSHYLNRAYIAAEIGIDGTLQPGTFVVGNGSVSYGTDGTDVYIVHEIN